MIINLFQLISISAVFQSLILVVYLLFVKEKNRYNNIVFASLLVVFSILTLSSIILGSGNFAQYNNIAEIGNQFAFLFGPLFFLYYKSFFIKGLSFKVRNILYFLPFFFVLIVYVLIKFNFISFFIKFNNLEILLRYLEVVQNLVYIILVAGLIYKNKFYESKNNIGIIQIIWLLFVFAGSLMILVLRFIFFIVWNILGNHIWCEYTTSIYFLVSFLFFNTVFFIFLKNPGILQKKKKYENSLLTESDKSKYKNMIIEYMNSKKTYLDPDISLSDMAIDLSLSSKYLSQVINEIFCQNFFDFINFYRVEESKRILLEKSDKKTILEILYESGFNSKSTFNSAFKKVTNLTPKEFKKKYN